jgi:hypothetical protein
MFFLYSPAVEQTGLRQEVPNKLRLPKRLPVLRSESTSYWSRHQGSYLACYIHYLQFFYAALCAPLNAGRWNKYGLHAVIEKTISDNMISMLVRRHT